MSDIYEELKDVTILCPEKGYAYVKEYLEHNFPGRPVIMWDLDRFNEINLLDNIHYMSVFFVPYITGEVLKFIPGTWRYSYRSSEDVWIFVNIDPVSIDIPYDIPVFPKGCKVSFLNTEHLTDKNTLEYINRKLSDKIDIYHHSLENTRIMGRGKCIPYRITDIETAKLKRYLEVPKKYDVCIIGKCSERRKDIVNKLLNRMINVLTIGGISKCSGLNNKYLMLGEERDVCIGEARILLNIHLRTNWTIYESIRCERWRAAGMLVISETCEAPGPPSDVIVCDYDDIVTTVVRELAKLKMKSH